MIFWCLCFVFAFSALFSLILAGLARFFLSFFNFFYSVLFFVFISIKEYDEINNFSYLEEEEMFACMLLCIRYGIHFNFSFCMRTRECDSFQIQKNHQRETFCVLYYINKYSSGTIQYSIIIHFIKHIYQTVITLLSLLY